MRLRHIRMYMTFYACPSYVIFTTECQCENLNFRPRQCGVASTHRCIFSMKTTIWVLKTQNFFWPHGADGHRAKKWWKSWGMRQNRGGVTAGTAVTRECRASSPSTTRPPGLGRGPPGKRSLQAGRLAQATTLARLADRPREHGTSVRVVQSRCRFAPLVGMDLAAMRVGACGAAGEPGCLVYATMVCALPIGPCS